jgi:hypothetical protein
LVAGKTECGGSEVGKGKLPSVDDCASKCEGVASMFAFGTNDFGTDRCNDEGCSCYCETSATEEGTCEREDHNGYRLYKYGISNSKGDYHELHIRKIFN